VFFGLALWAAHHVLREHSSREIAAALRELPAPRIALSLVLAAGGYAALMGYELLGFRFIGRRLAPSQIALGSFVSYAVGNNVGHNLVGGATARYWMYTPLGVPAADIARIVLFCSVGFWLGFLALGAAAFISEPIALPAALRLPPMTTRPLGLAFVAILVAYTLLIARRRREFRIRRWTLSLPSPALSAGQLAVGMLELLCMSAALWVLLPQGSPGYAQFLPIFIQVREKVEESQRDPTDDPCERHAQRSRDWLPAQRRIEKQRIELLNAGSRINRQRNAFADRDSITAQGTGHTGPSPQGQLVRGARGFVRRRSEGS
jgi:uncharacterized membrane protein YbhN (UPF0104 family)